MSAGRTSGRGQHRLQRNNRARLRRAARSAPQTSTAVSAGGHGVFISPQHRAARLGSQGYSRFIGRVGALAVALGIGVGFTTSMPGPAWADDTDSSSSADSSSTSSSSAQSDTKSASDSTTLTKTTTSTSTASTGSASPSNTPASANDSSTDDPDTGIVHSSGGAQTGSYGPNASAPSSDDDTHSEPAASDASEASEPPDTGSSASPDTNSTDTGTTDAPESSADPDVPQTPAPQEDSTAGDNSVGTAPPTTPDDPESTGNSSASDVHDGMTSLNSGTGEGEPTQFRLFTASGNDEFTDSGPQLFAASGPEDNSAFTSTQDISLAAAQNPVQALMAIPATVVNIATEFVAAILSPFLAPGPFTPAQPPLTLFALLDWVRREIQRTFFNRSPNGIADVYTTSEDVGRSGNVLTNDTDADGDELTATLVTGPTHGDVTLNADGSFTYTPDANYNGTDTFTYKVSDEGSGHLHGLLGFFSADGGHTDTATVNINITAVNDAPVAVDDTATIAEDTHASGNVLGNDTDVDSGSLTAALGAGPTNGVAVVNANGSFTYTPNANFNGVDTFTYTVSDGAAADTGTVTVTVTAVPDAPVAVDDTATVAEDSGFSAIDVLANDSDADGDDLDITLVTFPVHGDVFTIGGTVSYRPTANFTGTDTFAYSISDGNTSDTATVTVTVSPVNDMPVTSGDLYTVAEDGTLTVAAPGVLGNDTDLDGDPLTAVLFSNPSNGTVHLNPDGSFSYTPNADFTGTDSFIYYANDGTTDANPSFVNIIVTGSPDDVVARDDTNTTSANHAVSGNVLTNDVAQNPDGPDESLTVTSTGGIATTGGGAVSMASDGTYTYTPATDFTGVDTFTYTVTDGVTTDVGQVSITVTPAAPENTPPVAVDDELFTDVDTPLVLTADDLLANDTDADGDTLTIFDATLPTNGTFTDGGNGTVIYTPKPGFTGTDTFTYQLTDGQDVSDIATVTITVGDATPTDNSAPVPGFDSLATAAGTPITIHDDDLLANDFDAEGDPLTVTITQTPTNGLLVLNPDGTHTYTPAAGFTGVDTFTYAVNDGYTDSAYSAVVTINVGTPPNTPPNANTDALFTPADTPRTITQDDLLGNDFDPNADTLIAFVISQPANGTVEYNQQDGTYTYIPNTGFTGTDTFYYTAYDGRADSTPTAVTINVGQPTTTTTDPVAGWDSLATAAGTPLIISPAALLANDFDADGDQLSVTIAQGPSQGLILNPDGTYTYTPAEGFTGFDTFSYLATDGHGGESDEAFVTIAVGVPANAAPSAADDTLTTPVDTPLTITHADLLANDVDPNGDDMIAFVVSNPAHGTLEYNEQDNTYTYTPDAGFVGTDTFYYTAFDGKADSTPTTVTITIEVANTPIQL
jgi:large repetitive protein